jgi:hypothetical protein
LARQIGRVLGLGSVVPTRNRPRACGSDPCRDTLRNSGGLARRRLRYKRHEPTPMRKLRSKAIPPPPCPQEDDTSIGPHDNGLGSRGSGEQTVEGTCVGAAGGPSPSQEGGTFPYWTTWLRLQSDLARATDDRPSPSSNIAPFGHQIRVFEPAIGQIASFGPTEATGPTHPAPSFVPFGTTV